MKNKFLATVRFKNERDAEYLIRAFFQNFNPESSIVVKGNEATLEILFEEPPIAIIEAISYCEVIELKYGEIPKVGENRDAQDTKANASTRERIKEGDGRKVEEKVDTSVSEVHHKRGHIILEKTDIPELEEIASKATSFEHFAELVAEWMEIRNRHEIFEQLIIVATEVENICWKELEKALRNKGITFGGAEKVAVSNKVSECKFYSKSTGEKATILPFLRLTSQFKDYPFANTQEQCNTEEIVGQGEKTVTPGSEEERKEPITENICKKRVKMECMPEIKGFEEILADIDKTQAVEDRVYNVLIAMGIKRLFEKERKQILNIVSTAIRKSPINLRATMEENGIPETDRFEIQMKISEFINNFVGMHDITKKIRLSNFLSDLQKVIMFENEIEKVPDHIT